MKIKIRYSDSWTEVNSYHLVIVDGKRKYPGEQTYTRKSDAIRGAERIAQRMMNQSEIEMEWPQ